LVFFLFYALFLLSFPALFLLPPLGH
jgi:hypothetical protein